MAAFLPSSRPLASQRWREAVPPAVVTWCRLGVLLCVLLLPALARAVDDPLAQARRLADAKHYDAALASVTAYLATHAGDTRAIFLKGVVLTEAGRDDAAIGIFKGLIKSHPELPEPYNNLAVIYAARGEYAKARDALVAAIDTHPSYAIAHENLGDIYARMAATAYDKALQLDDDNESVKTKLALVRELFSLRGRTRVAVVPAVGPRGASAPAAAATPAGKAPETAPAKTASAGVAPAKTAPAPGTPEHRPPARSAPQTATTAPGAAGGGRTAVQAVRAAVAGWAAAWSARDVPAYLAHYAADFHPPGGISRARWKVERRKRISTPKFIKIELSHLRVQMEGIERARVTFTQRYRSNRYADHVTKTLLMARRAGGKWKITGELSR